MHVPRAPHIEHGPEGDRGHDARAHSGSRLAEIGREALGEHVLEEREAKPLLGDELGNRLDDRRHTPENLRIRPLDVRKILADPGHDRLRRRLAGHPPEDPRAGALDDRVDHAEDDVDLRGEVVEERARGDFRGVGDLDERRLVVALLVEEARRDVHDRHPRALFLPLP